jgi:hypothetical protein
MVVAGVGKLDTLRGDTHSAQPEPYSERLPGRNDFPILWPADVKVVVAGSWGTTCECKTGKKEDGDYSGSEHLIHIGPVLLKF